MNSGPARPRKFVYAVRIGCDDYPVRFNDDRARAEQRAIWRGDEAIAEKIPVLVEMREHLADCRPDFLGRGVNAQRSDDRFVVPRVRNLIEVHLYAGGQIVYALAEVAMRTTVVSFTRSVRKLAVSAAGAVPLAEGRSTWLPVATLPRKKSLPETKPTEYSYSSEATQAAHHSATRRSFVLSLRTRWRWQRAVVNIFPTR